MTNKCYSLYTERTHSYSVINLYGIRISKRIYIYLIIYTLLYTWKLQNFYKSTIFQWEFWLKNNLYKENGERVIIDRCPWFFTSWIVRKARVFFLLPVSSAILFSSWFGFNLVFLTSFLCYRSHRERDWGGLIVEGTSKCDQMKHYTRSHKVNNYSRVQFCVTRWTSVLWVHALSSEYWSG